MYKYWREPTWIGCNPHQWRSGSTTNQIKDILESMGEIMDVLRESGFKKITSKPVFVLSPGYVHLPDCLKFVYAMITLFSEMK